MRRARTARQDGQNREECKEIEDSQGSQTEGEESDHQRRSAKDDRRIAYFVKMSDSKTNM